MNKEKYWDRLIWLILILLYLQLLLFHTENPQRRVNKVTMSVRFAKQPSSRTVRQKIDPSAWSTASIAPLTVAEAYIGNKTASLHQGISNLLQTLGKEFVKSWHEYHAKDKKVKKLESDSLYQPISSRYAFTLRANAEVKETQAFKDLQAEVEKTLDNFKSELRKHTVDCAKLERDHYLESSKTAACLLVQHTVAIFCTAHGLDDALVHDIAMECIRENGTNFVSHLNSTDASFLQLYKQETGASESVLTLSDTGNNVKRDATRCIIDILSGAIDAYLKQDRQNEITLTINRKAKLILTTKATNDSAMEVEKESTMSVKTMEELINKRAMAAVDRRFSQLNKEAKNGARGKTDSASKNKKNGKRGDQKDEKDGDSNTDSQKRATKKKTKGTKKQQDAKKNDSNKGTKQSSKKQKKK